MEMLVVIFLIILGVIVIGSIMGMLSSGRISKLEAQNRNLNERLNALESNSALGQHDAVKTAAPTPSPPIPAAPIITQPAPLPEPLLEPLREPLPEPLAEPFPEKPVEEAPIRAATTQVAPVKVSTESKLGFSAPAPESLWQLRLASLYFSQGSG